MRFRITLLSTICLCCAGVIIGCSRYSSIRIERESSSLEGVPISKLFTTWGKPSHFEYQEDGIVTMEWQGLYPSQSMDTIDISLDLAEEEEVSKLVCDVIVDIDARGKIQKHRLLCHQGAVKLASS